MKYKLDMIGDSEFLAKQCNEWTCEDKKTACPVGCPSAIPCPFHKDCDEITAEDWEELRHADI